MADPGFPVGGRGPRRGAWTPEAVTFRKFCMSKRKNLDPWGGGQAGPIGSSLSCLRSIFTHSHSQATPPFCILTGISF